MADYKIYIHSYADNGGGESSPTVPWTNQGGASGGDITPFQTAEQLASKAQQFATSGFKPYVNTGVALLAHSTPYIAATIAAIKLTDTILTVGFSHLEEYTGRYEYAMEFNNFKTTISNALNPIGLYLKQLHRQAQFDKENKRIEQERTLVGGSVLDISVRGV